MNIKTPSVTGDIILISQPKKNANLIVQSVLRFKKAEHSHVAVALYNFSLIHAMPKSGVHMQSLGSFLSQNRSFVVYRNRLALTEDKNESLEKYLRHHHRQGYSLLNLLFTSWRHSFCSELAAKAFKKSGIQLTKNDRKPRRVLPVDIYQHVSNDPDWVEVTECYREFFLDNEHSDLMEKAADVERSLVGLTQQMGYGQQKFVNVLNAAGVRQSDKTSLITPPMSFWSNRFAKRSNFLFLMSYWGKMAKELAQYVWFCIFKSRK